MAKSVIQCKFFSLSRGGGERLAGWCAHLITIHLLKNAHDLGGEKKGATNIFSSALKHPQMSPQLQQHSHTIIIPFPRSNKIRFFFLKSADNPTQEADSPASLLACRVKGVCAPWGECVWMCESLLQDSGTPSLPSPLSASV